MNDITSTKSIILAILNGRMSISVDIQPTIITPLVRIKGGDYCERDDLSTALNWARENQGLTDSASTLLYPLMTGEVRDLLIGQRYSICEVRDQRQRIKSIFIFFEDGYKLQLIFDLLT